MYLKIVVVALPMLLIILSGCENECGCSSLHVVESTTTLPTTKPENTTTAPSVPGNKNGGVTNEEFEAMKREMEKMREEMLRYKSENSGIFTQTADGPQPKKMTGLVSVWYQNIDPEVTGSWTGRWESGGQPGHGGELKCVATKAGSQKWDAVFTAEFGKTKAYTVKLEGKLDFRKVLFGGSVDLGKKEGGVFTWKGEATSTEFSGTYSGGGDAGTFKLTRTSNNKKDAPAKTNAK